MSKESPNLPLHNANFKIFISYMVPEILVFSCTETARPDLKITTFKFVTVSGSWTHFYIFSHNQLHLALECVYPMFVCRICMLTKCWKMYSLINFVNLMYLHHFHSSKTYGVTAVWMTCFLRLKKIFSFLTCKWDLRFDKNIRARYSKVT